MYDVKVAIDYIMAGVTENEYWNADPTQGPYGSTHAWPGAFANEATAESEECYNSMLVTLKPFDFKKFMPEYERVERNPQGMVFLEIMNHHNRLGRGERRRGELPPVEWVEVLVHCHRDPISTYQPKPFKWENCSTSGNGFGSHYLDSTARPPRGRDFTEEYEFIVALQDGEL